MDYLSITQTIALVVVTFLYFRVNNTVKRLSDILMVQDTTLSKVSETFGLLHGRIYGTERNLHDTIDTVNNLLDRSVQIGLLVNNHSANLEEVNKQLLLHYGDVPQKQMDS